MRSVNSKEAITMEIRTMKMALCRYNISWPKTKHGSPPSFKELTRTFHDLLRFVSCCWDERSLFVAKRNYDIFTVMEIP